MNTLISKAGVHCIGPNRKGYADFLARIDAVGRRLSLVKCRNDFSAIDEPLALWPDMPTIGAMTKWDDADYDVPRAYRRIVAAAANNPKIKYWEYFNEREDVEQQMADFYIALMPLLHEVGIGLCMFNSSSGRPQYPDIDPDPYRHIARACKVAKDNGYDVILGLHEYVHEDDMDNHIGRFRVLTDYLDDHNALIPIAITECGFETHPGDHKFIEMVKHIDPVYMADDAVLGYALWTLGGGGWGGSNYQTALPELGEYIATVQPVDPVDPIMEHTFVTRDSGAADAVVMLLDDRRAIYTHSVRQVT